MTNIFSKRIDRLLGQFNALLDDEAKGFIPRQYLTEKDKKLLRKIYHRVKLGSANDKEREVWTKFIASSRFIEEFTIQLLFDKKTE